MASYTNQTSYQMIETHPFTYFKFRTLTLGSAPAHTPPAPLAAFPFTVMSIPIIPLGKPSTQTSSDLNKSIRPLRILRKPLLTFRVWSGLAQHFRLAFSTGCSAQIMINSEYCWVLPVHKSNNSNILKILLWRTHLEKRHEGLSRDILG